MVYYRFTLFIFVGTILCLFVGFVSKSSAQSFVFSRYLQRGSTGIEVQKLQEFLKNPPYGGVDIYPEQIISNYFGIRTENAVKRFQKKYGILSLGVIGPRTRAKLNELQTTKKEIAQIPPPSPTPTALPPCATPTATGCTKATTLYSFDPSGGKCQGTEAVMFGASPFKLDQIELIEPMGQTVGGHVTPIDHGYIFGKGTPDVMPDTFDIQSPTKGYVVDISRTQRGDFSDYALTIEFSCTLFVHYSNMTSFAPKLIEAAGSAVGPHETKNIRVPVAEGELVGRTGAYGIDLYVWDLTKTLSGFVNPASYNTEQWKTHSAQFFDYVKEPLKTELLRKDVRQVEPRFGKIDYDIDGKLVGTWFQKDTHGYGGLNRGGEGYWAGHLSIAYDAIDPSGIIVSIGNWNGAAEQFGIRNNAPDPKNVSIQTGIVKYELLQLNWILASTGTMWTHRNFAADAQFKPIDGTPNALKGIILLQLTGTRTLKVEMFPGKTAADISSFTDQALIYER